MVMLPLLLSEAKNIMGDRGEERESSEGATEGRLMRSSTKIEGQSSPAAVPSMARCASPDDEAYM